MAASVQDLLLAAKSKRSPFMALAEGAAQGFGQAQNGALERTKTLMMMQQAQEANVRAQQEHAMQMQAAQQKAEAQAKLRAEYAADQEASIKTGHKAVAGRPNPVTTPTKFEKAWTEDEGGLKKVMKTVESTATASGADKPPPGFRWTKSGDLEAIPGGPAAIKGQQPAKLTKAQEAVDRKFGMEYADYVAGGGYADVMGQISTLGDVLKDLEAGGKNLTGPFIASMPQRFRSTSTAAQQAVEQSVQRTLKQTLGGQFTEKEGVMFMQRGYDPRLDEAENAKKLRRAVNELKSMALAKQRAVQYYEENGTLAGFKGEFYTVRNGEMVKATIDDFYQMMGVEGPARGNGGGGLSPEEQAELDALEKEIGGGQ